MLKPSCFRPSYSIASVRRGGATRISPPCRRDRRRRLEDHAGADATQCAAPGAGHPSEHPEATFRNVQGMHGETKPLGDLRLHAASESPGPALWRPRRSSQIFWGPTAQGLYGKSKLRRGCTARPAKWCQPRELSVILSKEAWRGGRSMILQYST